MKKLIKKIILLLILGGIAMIGYNMLDAGPEPIRYRTGTISKGDISEVVTANGTLNPVQLVTVGTQVSGQINKILVKVNDHVTKGQLLAEVDPAIPEAELKQAQSSLELARISYEQAERDLARTKALVARDFVPKAELERAEQSYLSAKISYESAITFVDKAKVNLAYTKITSPIDGVVISQEVTDGQTVAATYQTPNLFKIAGDLAKMKIDVNFSEADINKVKSDMPVRFTVDAFPDRNFEGTIDMVNLNPNATSGIVTYSVTVTVNNADLSLLPGMSAYVNVILSEVKDVLRVPASAFRFAPPQEETSALTRLFQPSVRRRWQMPTSVDISEGQKATIHLLKGDKPEPVEVTIGKSDEMQVAITGEGIKDGDTVITGTYATLRK